MRAVSAPLLVLLCSSILRVLGAPRAPVTMRATYQDHADTFEVPVVVLGVPDAAFDGSSALNYSDVGGGTSLRLPASVTNLTFSWHATSPARLYYRMSQSAVSWTSDGAAEMPAVTFGGDVGPTGELNSTNSATTVSAVTCSQNQDAVVTMTIFFWDDASWYEPVVVRWTWRCVRPGCGAECPTHGTCDYLMGYCACQGRWMGKSCQWVFDYNHTLCPQDRFLVRWGISWAPLEQEYYEIGYYLEDGTYLYLDWLNIPTGGGATSGTLNMSEVFEPGTAYYVSLYKSDFSGVTGEDTITVLPYEQCGFEAQVNRSCPDCSGHGSCSNASRYCACTANWWWVDCSHGCSELATLTSSTGVITTDVSGYRDVYTYKNYAACSWLIVPEDPGSWDAVEISLDVCDLSYGDTMTFYEADANGTKKSPTPLASLSETCKDGLRETIVGTKRILAEFVADYSTVGRGIHATYRTVTFPKPRSNNLAVILGTVLPISAMFVVGMVVLLVLYRRSQNKVRKLREKMEHNTMADLMGTPAEDVVKTLLRLEKKRVLTGKDREDIKGVVGVISTNKLFKLELRKKLGARVPLDQDVDAFLYDTLHQEGAQTPHLEEVCTRTRTLHAIDKPPLEEEFSKALDSWDFDVLRLEEAHRQDVVMSMSTLLFDSYKFVDGIGLDEQKVRRFFLSIQGGYKENPYHCALHAADVAQALHCLVSASGIKFSDTELMAAVVAALCHDYKHPGVNSAFLQNTLNPLALRYNFTSILESMHAAETLSLLLSEPCSFLRELPKETVIEFCRTVSALVIATDMSKHAEIMGQVSVKLASNNVVVENKSDRLLILQLFMKFADLSNSSRSWSLCETWARRISEEFFIQGDRERELGLPVSAFMDRNTQDIPKCQQAFIDFIVRPLAELLCQVVPPVRKLLRDNLAENLASWKRQRAASMLSNNLQVATATCGLPGTAANFLQPLNPAPRRPSADVDAVVGGPGVLLDSVTECKQ